MAHISQLHMIVLNENTPSYNYVIANIGVLLLFCIFVIISLAVNSIPCNIMPNETVACSCIIVIRTLNAYRVCRKT